MGCIKLLKEAKVSIFMKKNEINNFIINYICPFIKGYSVYQNIIYKLTEDGFFIKGYHFYAKGESEVGLNVHSFILPLYVKDDRISFMFAEELYYYKKISVLKKIKMVWWDNRKENQEASFEFIKEAILKQGEVFLGAINTPEDFYKKFKSEIKDNVNTYLAVAYSTVLFGNEELQNKFIKGLIDFCSKEISNYTHREFEAQIKQDATLLFDARTTEKRMLILRDWASETITNLKLPKLKLFV